MTQKESNAIDGHIDQIVKARWLAIGLSQADLAEVLGLAFAAVQKEDRAPNGAARHLHLVEAGDVPNGLDRQNADPTQEDPDSSSEPFNSLQTLLALRLLRAFHELTDQGAKEVLVQLAEQIVKRQIDRR